MKIYFANGLIKKGRFEGSYVHITEVVNYLCENGHRVYLPPSDCEVGTLLPENRLLRLPAIFRADVHYFRFQGMPVLPNWYEKLRKLGIFRQPIVWEMNATTELQKQKFDDERFGALVEKVANEAKLVSLAVCNTPALARYSKAIGIPLTNVVPLGANPELFPRKEYETQASRPLKVTWMGNADIQWHDFETMKQAAVELENDKNIEFHFLCKYEGRLPGNVKLHRPVHYTKLASWLAGMDVGLAMYNQETLFEYGIFSSPLKIFDYMSCGLTVLASPIEQVRELIEDGVNGFVVKTKSVDGLVNRLRQLSRDRSPLAPIGRAARRTVVDYFNWERVGRETEQLLTDLVSGQE